jgi:hypothetical protein
MNVVNFLVWLGGGLPIWRMLQANRQTSLKAATRWALAAWLAWGVTLALALGNASFPAEAAYLALCLTGCAGIAVLGARRPGVGPWNFVLLALLAVNLLPLAAARLRSTELAFADYHGLLAAGVVLVSLLNYLPSRLGLAALFALFGCAVVIARLAVVDLGSTVINQAAALCLAMTPWLGYWSLHRRTAARVDFDNLWLDFRDRFGFVWAQRLREQFNRSAANAGWQVALGWNGLRPAAGTAVITQETRESARYALDALLKRFRPEGN